MEITNQLLEQVLNIACHAGEKIMDIYRSGDFQVRLKSDQSPLTDADMSAHQEIHNALTRLTPQIPQLSEESDNITWEQRKSWRHYWLIDPLDGTKEFVHQRDEFTVNIALIEDGVAILGIVYAPALKTAWYAAKSVGAFKKVIGEEATPIKTNPWSNGTWKIVGSRSHSNEATENFIDCLGETELISMGSSIKLCLVAEGSAHIYPRLGPTSEWDTAAAQCVVETAGGHVIDEKLNRLTYNQKPTLLNPHFIVTAGAPEDWADCLSQ